MSCSNHDGHTLEQCLRASLDTNDPEGEFGPDAPLLCCGCPVAHVRDNGHQEGCHQLCWLHKRSFHFQAGCTCGWQGHDHVMERQAKDEFDQHAAS